MVKKRLVIAISPRPRTGQQIVHIVPLSTTEPKVIAHYHIPIKLPPSITSAGGWKEDCWAKCEMINSVSYARLELIRLGKDASGKRLYSTYVVDKETLNNIRKAAAKTLGVLT